MSSANTLAHVVEQRPGARGVGPAPDPTNALRHRPPHQSAKVSPAASSLHSGTSSEPAWGFLPLLHDFGLDPSLSEPQFTPLYQRGVNRWDCTS